MATAVSTALPPASSTATPTSVASAASVETMPRRLVAAGVGRRYGHSAGTRSKMPSAGAAGTGGPEPAIAGPVLAALRAPKTITAMVPARPLIATPYAHGTDGATRRPADPALLLTI